ncbi:MAG TPA: hypothetical protein DF613_14050 [Lachnospiraceae bacterium]|nr:hypothetical protein [Lachnospiraceae bacterium]
MLEIKTAFGTFGNFTDLARYMLEEGITQVTVDAYYIFSKVAKITFSLDELRGRLRAGELA